MVKPKLDKKYTDLWVKDFDYENVDSYNKKWFNKFEKNSKHWLSCCKIKAAL